ncbi:MAG: 1-(5-phosphoribosyl)-5-[(5-phosphoribosylamino)methylideneamino]imidazole-4-carboxamide isomerase [Candidatus Sumerlaeota bacterium]|nr:1-(5-phosphoribosyl)-5-[(5-phosphoribosylamino)methylideneamino]imidazole-4-carboxamide isomerase [Candidatus Sumerlaeota bacterium]
MGRDFLLIPAIDLMDGHCVRLQRGRADQRSVYSDNPPEMARSFELSGAKRLHIVDLDGAFSGKPRNLEAIRSIRERVGAVLEVGGGLRTAKDVETLFDLGVEYAVLGTRVVESPEFLEEMIGRFGQRIIVSVDAHDGKVAVRGWVEVRDLQALEFAQRLESAGVGAIVYTDIATDGTLQGPNLVAQRSMAEQVGMSVIASGGVSCLDDVLALAAIPRENLIGTIVGKALYDGKLNLAEALAALRSPV